MKIGLTESDEMVKLESWHKCPRCHSIACINWYLCHDNLRFGDWGTWINLCKDCWWSQETSVKGAQAVELAKKYGYMS